MAGVKGRSGGHNRQTLEAHELHGTFRPSRHGALALVTPAPIVGDAPPAPPASLSRAARNTWRAIVNEFDGWDAAGLTLLVLALEAQVRAEQCRRRIRREGLLITGRRGAQRLHPLLRVERQSADFAARALGQLGLGGRT